MADLWRGGITLRKAGVLAKHLPPEAAIYRVGPDDQLWSRETQFLARATDILAHLSWQWGGDSKQPAPEPTPRPSDGLRKQQAEDQIAERAARWAARQQQRGLAGG